jgi:hypothetical protein
MFSPLSQKFEKVLQKCFLNLYSINKGVTTIAFILCTMFGTVVHQLYKIEGWLTKFRESAQIFCEILPQEISVTNLRKRQGKKFNDNKIL